MSTTNGAWARIAVYPLLGLVSACGAHASPRPAAVAPTQPNAPSSSPGLCGGFEQRPLAAKPTALLNGRLFVRALEGAVDAARPADIMSAPPPDETETRLFLRDGDRKLVVMSEELGATAGADLLSRVRTSDPRLADARFEAVTLPSGLAAVLAQEPKLAGKGDAIAVAHAFTRLPDHTLQVTRVFVSPEVVQRGSDGCAKLAVRLLTTLAPGDRRLELGAGERKLGKDFAVSVPESTWVFAERGPDFVVYRFLMVRPLGDPQAQMGIYVGGHPQFAPAEDAKQVPGRLLGQSIVWYEAKVAGGLHREALAKLGEESVHVFFAAPPTELPGLVRIAESLRSQRSGP